MIRKMKYSFTVAIEISNSQHNIPFTLFVVVVHVFNIFDGAYFYI